MWAEWSAATRRQMDPSEERRRLWRIDVDGLRVLDLRRPSVRAELGVELERLTGPRRAAQAFSATALALGAEGMIVPSAALAGRWNLVVFPAAFAKLAVAGATTTRPRPPG